MNSVQDSSINSVAASSVNPAASGATNRVENAQDRFLKLLVTQMQNQNPLNPLDNAEVTSQLAQISTVTGIDKLNDTLKLLVSDFEENRSMEAAAMIGRSVLVPGNTMTLENNAAIAGIDLPQAVDHLTVTILDSAGIAVRKLHLGPQAEGINTFVWDGVTDSGAAAASGKYTFLATAKQGDQDVNPNALALGSINSVSRDEKGTILEMGELGLAGLTDIKQIF